MVQATWFASLFLELHSPDVSTYLRLEQGNGYICKRMQHSYSPFRNSSLAISGTDANLPDKPALPPYPTKKTAPLRVPFSLTTYAITPRFRAAQPKPTQSSGLLSPKARQPYWTSLATAVPNALRFPHSTRLGEYSILPVSECQAGPHPYAVTDRRLWGWRSKIGRRYISTVKIKNHVKFFYGIF